MEVDKSSGSKRAEFRRRLTITIQSIEERQRIINGWKDLYIEENGKLDDGFYDEYSESDFDTPLYIMNVMMMAPTDLNSIVEQHKKKVSVDDMMVGLYSDKWNNEHQLAKFVPDETQKYQK
jgi:hypothetical protein